MPKLTVSDELHAQLQTASTDGNVEEAMWEMIGMYRRRENPQADVR